MKSYSTLTLLIFKLFVLQYILMRIILKNINEFFKNQWIHSELLKLCLSHIQNE